jgi:hypothetical protein
MTSTIRVDITVDGLQLLRAYYALPGPDRARFLRAMRELAASQRRQRQGDEFAKFMTRVHDAPPDTLPG